MPKSSVAVIDASFALCACLNYPESPKVMLKLSDLISRHTRLVAPHFWMAEITSALHRLQQFEKLSPREARDALELLLQLDLALVPCDAALCRQAYDLANTLNQSPAYDYFYLALAQNLGAELLTCDKRLEKLAGSVPI
jgi:predicted nucleic acid-binding protein